MKVYNVVVRVVDLVWADSPEEATAMLTRTLVDDDYEVLPDGSNAFVSEPVPEMGWNQYA
jgi:hypothetical protein